MVRHLRLLQAAEHHPAVLDSHRLGAPDLVDALFCRCIRGIPPAVNGFHHRVARVPLLCKAVGILPAAAQHKVVALAPHVSFAVEVAQQKGSLFCARRL